MTQYPEEVQKVLEFVDDVKVGIDKHGGLVLTEGDLEEALKSFLSCTLTLSEYVRGIERAN